MSRTKRNPWHWHPERVLPVLLRNEEARVELKPLLLYRGNLDFPRARGLYNFTLAMKEAEVASFANAEAMSVAGLNTVTHLTGNHRPVRAQALAAFFARLLRNPELLKLRPEMGDYVHWLASNEWRHIGWRLELQQISASGRSRRDWRRPKTYGPIPAIYPFLDEWREDYGLLKAVDEAIPKINDEWLRQEACQDLAVALLDGRLTVDDLKDRTVVASFLRSARAMFPTHYGAPLSLDTPLRGYEEGTLGAALTSGALILGAERWDDEVPT